MCRPSVYVYGYNRRDSDNYYQTCVHMRTLFRMGEKIIAVGIGYWQVFLAGYACLLLLCSVAQWFSWTPSIT